MIIVFSAFLLSCSDTENIVEREEEFPQAKNYAKPLPLTHSEFLFQTKISELGNNTMDADFLNMSDLEKEHFAIEHLKTESHNILKENGYTEEKIQTEFKTEIEILHKALYFYSLKVNNR